MEFREAFDSALVAAYSERGRCGPNIIAFLKALEAHTGGKFVMPEPTWQMNTAAPSGGRWPHRNIYGDLDRTGCENAAAEIFKAMHAAAPTVTDLPGEK
jgi:hypothetical protein